MIWGEMQQTKTDWTLFRDVRRDSRFRDPPKFTEPVHGFGGNVGEMMAAEMAAAGTCALILGGATPCETDYLAASGAVFPSSVTAEEMEEFNRETLRPEMDEADEFARYAAIAKFFGRSPHAV